RAARAVLARVAGTPAGCVLYEVHPDHVSLSRLAVLPAYRRRGLARALIDSVELRARRRGLPCVRLGVRVALPRQRAYHERLGYHFAEARGQACSGHPTCVILAKHLRGYRAGAPGYRAAPAAVRHRTGAGESYRQQRTGLPPAGKSPPTTTG